MNQRLSREKCLKGWNIIENSIESSPTLLHQSSIMPPAQKRKASGSVQNSSLQKKRKTKTTPPAPSRSTSTSSSSPRSRSPTIEVIDDDNDNATQHGSHPKRSGRILEAADGSDDNDDNDNDSNDGVETPEESTEEELGE